MVSGCIIAGPDVQATEANTKGMIGSERPCMVPPVDDGTRGRDPVSGGRTGEFEFKSKSETKSKELWAVGVTGRLSAPEHFRRVIRVPGL